MKLRVAGNGSLAIVGQNIGLKEIVSKCWGHEVEAIDPKPSIDHCWEKMSVENGCLLSGKRVGERGVNTAEDPRGFGAWCREWFR